MIRQGAVPAAGTTIEETCFHCSARCNLCLKFRHPAQTRICATCGNRVCCECDDATGGECVRGTKEAKTTCDRCDSVTTVDHMSIDGVDLVCPACAFKAKADITDYKEID